MTERDWLSPRTTYAPDRMLDFLLRERGVARRKTGRRRLRLLACACCHWVWDLLRGEHSQLVETAERLADTLTGAPALAVAASAARQARPADVSYNGWAAAKAAEAAARPNAAEAARAALRRSFDAWARDPKTPGALDPKRWAEAEAFQCALLRDLFDNPFHPVAVDPAWQTPRVTALATAAYEARILPAGNLDRQRLPTLADVLEEASCSDVEILTHLRRPGPHVRGCWALDLLLGKE